MLTSKLRCHYRTAPCASGTLTEVYILKHMPAMGMMSEMCVCHQTTASKQLQRYSKCNQALSIWHVNGLFFSDWHLAAETALYFRGMLPLATSSASSEAMME